MKYILDSSIILELFLSEEKNTIRMVKRFISENYGNILSSDFLKLEVTNVLVRRIDSKDILNNLFTIFQNMSINYLPLENIHIEMAKDIAKNSNTSVYDASYHSLAIYKDFMFITLDKKYYSKTEKLGNIQLFT